MIISDNRDLFSLKFKKYLLKLNILNYLHKEGLISDEVYELSIVQIKKL